MAMAPEQTGIGIRRYFTTEGIHPYDEVVWERRDARIINFRDGSVAFEQCDVEFPVTWSQNATNIVAQKYFRGQLGSPERETSLRQVIDRVADTITAWGVKGGYFVDEPEAEIFRAELKHLILHQKASFNSPVWFNIGVPGATQQASACQPYDALVSTPQGLVPIGRLVEQNAVGTKVFDAHGLTRIVAVKANGTKPVLRLHLKAGYRLDVTADHLVWRAGGTSSGSFQPAGALRRGDKLEWYRAESYGEAEITPLAVAEAALAGWLQSDGLAGQHNSSDRSLATGAVTITDAERAWLSAAIDTAFPNNHSDERSVTTVDEILHCGRTGSYGNALEDLVDRWNLRSRGHDTAVPDYMFTAPLPVVAAYLKSLFHAEGYVSRRDRSAVVGLAVISERLASGVQSLLLRFGIYSQVRFAGRSRLDGLGCWVLAIRPLGDRRRFADEIGFIDPVKAARLEESFGIGGARSYATEQLEIERIEELGEIDVYDIQTESGEYLSGNIRVHNCFILAVEDTMQSILNWYVEEGTIFKGGSGSGINLSTIRSSYESLKGGGTASGPVSFMRGADASAGTIKSGGTTRRAAKMVVLNADHPDVEDFIWCKAVEERKARVLRDAGFDMDLDGKDSHSTQYQNANNSVRVTDEFMDAVIDDADWHLRAVTTGEPIRTVKARELFRQIAESAWECADPGMQFDTTINRWHTAPNTGRITASNPCFTGDSLVHTDKGLIRFDDLLDRARQGETFGVYTHDATNPDAPAEVMEVTSPTAYMVTGLNEIVRLRFSNGMELRCTRNHRVFTINRGYVEASALTAEDQVKVLDLPAPAFGAGMRLPVSSNVADYAVNGEWSRSIRLPEKWTPEFAHYLGWLVGEGCIGSDGKVTTMYGDGGDERDVLSRHVELLTWMNGDRPPEPSVQHNGTIQLHQTGGVIANFLGALGVSHSDTGDKAVPWSVQQAPPEILAAFLRGLFDAEGCVSGASDSRHFNLRSPSPELLQGVQRLLSTFGIFSAIHTAPNRSDGAPSSSVGDGAVSTSCERSPMYDLRISARSLASFAAHIGLSVGAKLQELNRMVPERETGRTKNTVTLVEREDDGVELTYNLTEPRNHSYVVNGIVVANCSEYLHIDNSACNLASLNLLKFLDEDNNFDVDGFKAAVSVVFTAQEILVGNADYPTEKIAENSRRFRQLGLGYANLGALLMALGLPYDSDAGRAWASGITALMTGHAYATSARTAARMGPFAGYMENQQPMNNVLRMHRDELGRVDESLLPAGISSAAREAWDTAVELGELYGVRNSQATVLAPTGCLVGGSLIPTERGLVRLGSLGDTDGAQWQDLDIDVATDHGPRRATRFYVNGVEPVVSVRTAMGYGIDGTTQHRVKVVDPTTGAWDWKRMSDLQAGDVVPLAMNQLLGRPQRVTLPALPSRGRGDDADVHVPLETTAQLAELAGYFVARGSVTDKGVTFTVAGDDLDAVDRLRVLGKEAFGFAPAVARRRRGTQVTFASGRLAQWWSSCGFSRKPMLPDAVLRTNNPRIYAAYLRGLFEGDGSVSSGVPQWSTTSVSFSREVQTLMLALGYPTVRGSSAGKARWREAPAITVGVHHAYAARWQDDVGFMSAGKNRAITATNAAAFHDEIPLPAALVDRLAQSEPWLSRRAAPELASVAASAPGHRSVSRLAAAQLFERTGDRELGHLLAFFYDTVTSAELGEDQFTYDISVPDNVTYLANGFVSHNTIGLMMDCDTTGIEPDLGLCKTKKLVGGGTMSIVNHTVPRALRRMGYSPEQIDDIIGYIDEHKSIVGAPHLSGEHLPVFACSMGDNVIHYLGHVKMMAAVQPWISGAISKCVTGDTLLSTADGLVRIGKLHQGEPSDSFRDEIIEVASIGGTQKTNAFYYGGVRPVMKVVLESGHRVVGTPNHRLLVAGACGLEWRRLDELEVGDAVAVQYGADLWSSVPARIEGLVARPGDLTPELAFLLGALCAAGDAVRSPSDGTVTIATSTGPVLPRLAAAWKSELGVDARIIDVQGRRAVVVKSDAALGLVDALTSGGGAAGAGINHIPDAILESPRPVVVAFLQGLAELAADVTLDEAAAPAWIIRVDSPSLLDDLQAVFTNLGVVHWRPEPGEVRVSGRQAVRLLELIPFSEAAKATRAATMAALVSDDEPPEVVPALSGDERVLTDNVRFSPVAAVAGAGHREVFDVSVPATHAFVGNGIVNHNTINMPEEATVEEVEQLHLDAWRMGLKAVAIYRDNCKVGQPLSTTKKAAVPVVAAAVEPVATGVLVREPVREKLPRRRNSKTFSFRVADCHGYVTVGEYDDGRPGEIFLRVAKQGSTLAGIMDAFAISVSHGLQYGVPLRAFVEMYTNMRFEPAGMTDDPDIRFASSLVDYIFRRLAVEYLPYDHRAELGILTVEERMQPTLPGVEEQTTPTSTGADVVPDPAPAPAPALRVAAAAPPTPVEAPVVEPVASDAPYCYQCGMVMQRAGACFVCSSCGTTSGCS